MNRDEVEKMGYIDIVFDEMPGPEGSRFVEVENSMGDSICVGEWVMRPDNYAVLRLPNWLTLEQRNRELEEEVRNLRLRIKAVDQEHEQLTQDRAKMVQAYQALEEEIGRLKEIVESEPELPGEMPDSIYLICQRNKSEMEDVLRASVKATKHNILERFADADR